MASSKRLLFVLGKGLDGENWKAGDVDLETVREQVRQELCQEVPVVCLPEGACLWTVELGEKDTPSTSETSPRGEDHVGFDCRKPRRPVWRGQAAEFFLAGCLGMILATVGVGALDNLLGDYRQAAAWALLASGLGVLAGMLLLQRAHRQYRREQDAHERWLQRRLQEQQDAE